MIQMIFAGALFLGTHFALSSTPLRGQIVGKIGAQGFQGVYSVIALVTLLYMIWVYNGSVRTEYFWFPSPELYMVPKVLMLFAAIFVVGSFLVTNPTIVGFEKALEADGYEANGLLRITRHPFMWGVVLWAASHVAANGDVVSVVFFTTFGLIAGIGTVLIDRKKAVALGAHWENYKNQTSNIPFGAIFSGRNRLAFGEIWLAVFLGVLIYLAMYEFHAWLSGVEIA